MQNSEDILNKPILYKRCRSSSFNIKSSRTSTPIYEVQNGHPPDERYEKFKENLQNPTREPTIRGLKEIFPGCISAHLIRRSRAKSKSERDYTYIMVFPKSFNIAEFELEENYLCNLEENQNLYYGFYQVNLDCAIINHVIPISCPIFYNHQIYYNFLQYGQMYIPNWY